MKGSKGCWGVDDWDDPWGWQAGCKGGKGFGSKGGKWGGEYPGGWDDPWSWPGKGKDSWDKGAGGKGGKSAWGDDFFGGGKGSCGGGGKGGRLAGVGRSGPKILGISIAPDSGLCLEGFSNEAPAIAWAKADSVFSCAGDVVREVAADVVVEHDADWEKYPYVIEAVRQAGGEPDCLAIAKSPSQLKWAVGLASGWQGRERASKIALTVAIASGTQKMDQLARDYPDFGAMCAAAELVAGQGAGGAPPLALPAMPLMDPAGPSSSAGMDQTCPPVIGISLPPEAQLVQQGLPSEAPVVSFGGKNYKHFFANASSIISELVDTSLVTFHDDPDWKMYPDVAAAIKQAGGEENCLMVARIDSLSVWAVGLAAGRKPRESASKMALAVALAPTSDQMQRLARSYPEFGAILASIGLEVSAEPQAKMRKL